MTAGAEDEEQPEQEHRGVVDGVAVTSVKGELIADQEVDKAEQDQLGHAQIAQQLADLTATVPVRSNIALYGAWGSGKSGIGNLLRADLYKRKSVGFARFDAFKYAENPLRRNFISAVATELEVEDPKFRRDLYTGKTTTAFDIPSEGLKKLVWVFLGSAALIFTGLLCLVAVAAALKSGPFWPDFREMANEAVLASLTPAALLSALVVLSARAFGVERKTDKAESSEQFEELFQQLIDKAGFDRVVVFVDELDRCAPQDVVATLDAVRTFLGNHGCVFVVAADRQVIEDALTEKLSQATPADPVNPYYSSGSAYLDKVFQYQVTVPPLLQASVTRYAVEMARPLPGVWSELGDRVDLTVSILVPSHVRSPRRVKNLLNAFALTYRLAEARERSGRLHGDMRERADEIARLVCLRIEFPLFAKKLVLDARLPEYVLRLFVGEPEEKVWEDHPHATAQVRQLARDYAGLKLPVATLLSTADDEQDDIDDEKDEEDEQTGGTTDDTDERTGDQDVGRQHGRQLLDYLSRTRSVNGPSRDLLFMQSEGAAVGLDGQLAERIEEDASNGAVQSLVPNVKVLGEDGRHAVLTLLIEQSRRAVGLEARGVALSLLAVASINDVDVPSRADALADALAPAVSEDPSLIDEGGLFGAWRLGLHSQRPTARELLGLVLRSDSAKNDYSVGMMILSHSEAALDADSDTTAELLSTYLLSPEGDDAAGTAQTLLKSDPVALARLIAASRAKLVAGLTALLTPSVSQAPAKVAAAPGRVAAPPQPAAAEPDPERPSTAPVVEALGLLLKRLDGGDGGSAQALTAVLLDVDNQEARNLLENHLPDIGQVDDPALASQILHACCRRALSNWPAWLAVVSSAAARADATDSALQQALNLLWTSASKKENPPSAVDLRAAATALVGLLDHRPEEQRPVLREAIQDSLGDAVQDDEQATERLRLLTAVEDLIVTGALRPGIVAAKEAEDLPATLRADLIEQDQDDPVLAYVSATVLNSLAGWERPGVAGELPSAEQARELVKALYECSWMPSPEATRLPLLARSRTGLGDDPELPALLSAEDVAALRTEHGSGVDDAIAAWIRLASPSAEELLKAGQQALSADQPHSDLLAALEERTGELAPKDRLDLLAGFLRDAERPAPNETVLRAAGSEAVPDIDIARVLTARQIDSTNEVRRRLLLEAWHRSGIESDGARRLLFEQILIPMFKPKSEGGSDSAVRLALEYLPRLAKTQPTGTKKPLGKAVVSAVGQEQAADLLKPLGYKSSKHGLLRRKTVETD